MSPEHADTHAKSNYCHVQQHKKAGATQIHLVATTSPFSSQQVRVAETQGLPVASLTSCPCNPQGHLILAEKASEIYPLPSAANISHHSHLTGTQLPPHASPSPLTSQRGAWDTPWGTPCLPSSSWEKASPRFTLQAPGLPQVLPLPSCDFCILCLGCSPLSSPSP